MSEKRIESSLSFIEEHGELVRIEPAGRCLGITMDSKDCIVIDQDLALELAQVLLNFAESGELSEPK